MRIGAVKQLGNQKTSATVAVLQVFSQRSADVSRRFDPVDSTEFFRRATSHCTEFPVDRFATCRACSPGAPRRHCPPADVAWVTLRWWPYRLLRQIPKFLQASSNRQIQQTGTESQQAGRVRRDTQHANSCCRAAGVPSNEFTTEQTR